jgi:hypothetical protein
MFVPSYLSAHGAFGPSGADSSYAGDTPSYIDKVNQYSQNIQATSDLVRGVKGFVGDLRKKKGKAGAKISTPQQMSPASYPVYTPATTAGGSTTTEEKDNTWLYVGGGVALLALIGAGIYFAKKR